MREIFEVSQKLESLVKEKQATKYAFSVSNKETKEFEVRADDDIMKGCLLTQGGQIIHERFKDAK